MHAEWADVGASVPISLDENGVFTSLFDVDLALNASEVYVYDQQAADGLPRRHRYRSACLGRIGRFSETYTT